MESPLSPSSHSSAKNLGQGAASSSSSSSNSHHRPPNGLDFVPPFRFALVEDGLYRGAYPTLRNFPFLSTLGLKTIVSLTPEEATYDLKEFCKSEGIQHRHISAERHKGDPQLLPTDLNDALHLLVNADLHPLYLHCLDGRHVTGLVVMALRKLLQWDYPSGQLEYQKFTRETKDETAFVMDYSGGLTLPLRIPKWFWSGSWQDQEGRLKRHPTLKFKYPAVQPLSATTKGSSTIRSLVPLSLDGSLDRTLNSPSRSSTGAGTPTNSSNGAAAAAVKSYVDVAAIPPLYVSANCFNHRTTTATPLTSSNPLATADPPTAAPKKSSSVLVRRGNSPHNQQTQPQQQLVPSQLNPTPQPSLTLTGGSVVLSSSVAAATASAVYDLLPGSRLQQQQGGSKGPTSVSIVSSSTAAADLSSLGSGGASASPPSSSQQQQQQPPSSQHGGCCGHTVAVIPNGTAQATDVQSWSVRTSLCVPKGFVTLDELMGVTDLAVIGGGGASSAGGGGGSMTFAGSPLTESLSQDQVALRMLATPSAPFPLLLQKHHHLHVLSATSQDKSRSRKQRSLSV